MRPYIPQSMQIFFNIANPKVQYSNFNVQSQSPYMLVAGTMDCQWVDTVGRNEGQDGERQVFWHQFTVSVPYGPVVCAR